MVVLDNIALDSQRIIMQYARRGKTVMESRVGVLIILPRF
jgi:hypothetical protein